MYRFERFFADLDVDFSKDANGIVVCVVFFMCARICLYRVVKTHRIPYLYRSFPAKVTYI